MKMVIILTIALCSASLSFAQSETSKATSRKTQNVQKAKYTCAMHPEVVSDQPGKCPKCNMQLTTSNKEQMKMEVSKLYTCSMHPEVQSKDPGKCPKCSMALTEVKPATKPKS